MAGALHGSAYKGVYRVVIQQLGVVDRSELDGFSDELIQNVDVILKRSEMGW